MTNWQQIDKTLAAPAGRGRHSASDGRRLERVCASSEIGTDNEHWTLATVSDEAKL